MAKKAAEKRYDMGKYIENFMSFVTPLISENKDIIVKDINSVVHFKRTMKRYLVFSTVLLVALFMILNGLGLLISSFFPDITPGIVYIAIGLILVLTVVVYNRLKL
jgi:hypothetical protein